MPADMEFAALSAEAAADTFRQLHGTLHRLFGSEGASVLVSRALALARSEVASLDQVRTTADGMLERAAVVGNQAAAGLEPEEYKAVYNRIIELLAIFLGSEPTFRLFRTRNEDPSEPA